MANEFDFDDFREPDPSDDSVDEDASIPFDFDAAAAEYGGDDDDLFGGIDLSDIPDSEAASAPRRRRASGASIGMTPPQRMILSVFLFLDISVLGCMFLLALNKVSI